MNGGLQLLLFSLISPAHLVCVALEPFATDSSNTWHYCFSGREELLWRLHFRALKLVASWDKWLKLMSQLEPEVRVLCPLVVHSGSFSTVAQLLPDFLCHFQPWVLELLFMLTCCSTQLLLSGWDFVLKMDCTGGMIMAVWEMHLQTGISVHWIFHDALVAWVCRRSFFFIETHISYF